MKKAILIILSSAIAAVTLSAQDMATATETFNNGATAQNMGDYDSALNYYREAMTMAEACGEEGADIVANCKTYIPVLTLAIAKNQIKSEAYDEALAKIAEEVRAFTKAFPLPQF